ncbi:MAG: polyprenyl diphosphate synthase [Armatimonadota bacterium]|nr:polyprenyl diphosphate synthase [Armatimonadota bacterium]MDR7421319.1 polyprenyl diphosphate synthase [Armatimonadota bacterium]MDR7455402.1 polyprenyl diphosphate synthase [Armatimonadota bacterium]MDR7512586.1 polyprenyl diphosphate synthase [Armatimonadota bacterium]
MASPSARPALAAVGSPVPAHVAIIMDGNGRWASARGLPRAAGHRAGRDAVRRTVEAARELGVDVLTLYAFSTENWRRPSDEVGALLALLHEAVLAEAEELHRSGIQLRVCGALDGLAPETRAELDRVVALTSGGAALILNIAFNYGSRAELARAARLLAADVAAGARTPESIDEAAVAARLYTAGLPDPDLLIRTGREQRLSNFLLWQCAYAELVFLDVLWPDFGRDHLVAAIATYQQRQRRFGAAPGG